MHGGPLHKVIIYAKSKLLCTVQVCACLSNIVIVIIQPSAVMDKNSRCNMGVHAADNDGADNLGVAATSSAASGDTSVLAGSANYVFFDADEAANQKQQKKKGKGKKE